MRQIYVNGFFKNYSSLCSYSLKIGSSEEKVVSQRLRIIDFYDTYGKEATREAFGVSRSTVYLWRAKLRDSGGRLEALAPRSRAPHRKRARTVKSSVVDFIKEYRSAHPGIGKETIAAELGEHCRRNELQMISVSTVGRVIKDLKAKNLIPTIKPRLTLHGRSGELREARDRPRIKKVRRKGYQPAEAGDLVQLDSIVLFQAGLKSYVLSAYDVKTAFGFAFAYSSHTAASAVDFMRKLQAVAPFTIRRAQTDNGSEFGGVFADYLRASGIVHFHNYPRSPKSNAYVERFNRTLKEQHINWHRDELYDTAEFNRGLMKYLVWYNTKKPHTRLGRLPPLRYHLDTLAANQAQSNMSWTSTCT